MKAIIKVSVKCRTTDPLKSKADALAVGLFSDWRKLDPVAKRLDAKLDGAIKRLIESGDFSGKEGDGSIIYANKEIGPKRILVIGLGAKKQAKLDTIRKGAANAAKRAVETRIGSLNLSLHTAFGARFADEDAGRAMAEGVYFGSYRYDEFVSDDENGRLSSLKATVVEADSKKAKQLRKGVAVGDVVGTAQSFGRTIANRPGNVIDPPALAAKARALARDHKTLSCTVWDKKRLTAQGMNGILAVGAGSKSEPRFIVLKYTPNKAAADTPTVALVGKAVTFDSGGISIKPGANMDQMKLDKSGGIAVLATMQAVAGLNLPIKVYGLIPSAENMPGGASYRPGDIIKTYSGKTVEILNTDAEGRMILCDGIAYAVKQKCDIIVDIATLTGACMVALGNHMAGLMSNDDSLLKQLQKAAEESGERLWHLPSGDEYAGQMKSKIADLRNMGGKWGGASTAAAFLRQFAGETTWAHLDIAGMDIYAKGTKFSAPGSTGFGVRLLTRFLANLSTK